MQTKKEDLRQTIIEVSKTEFLKRGYDDTSMRMIAKKANTTVGNIYHYFPSKESILDDIMEPAIHDLDILLKEHIRLNIKVESVDEILEILDNENLERYHMQNLLSKEIAILFEIKHGKYKTYRDQFFDAFQQHIAWHLNVDDKDDYFVKVICKAVIECIITVVKTNSNYTKAKKDFIRFFKMICTGLVVNKHK